MTRDARLLALLLVLVLSAVVLVVTSWPERDDIASLRAEKSDEAPEPTPSRSGVPAEGRRVARHFAEAYFSTSATSAAARRKRLERYSSKALTEEMQINSGALALLNSTARAPSEAEVIALQTQDSTAGNALVAIVEHSTSSNGKTKTELVTVTLELVEEDGEWLVAEVLVP